MFNMFINLTSIYTFLIPRDSVLFLNQCTCLVLYLDSDSLTLIVLVLAMSLKDDTDFNGQNVEKILQKFVSLFPW